MENFFIYNGIYSYKNNWDNLGIKVWVIYEKRN